MKTCYYCETRAENVEASGMYYCPNPICDGPGAAWFRRKLKSFDEKNDKHTINETEREFAAKLYLKARPIFITLYGED